MIAVQMVWSQAETCLLVNSSSITGFSQYNLEQQCYEQGVRVRVVQMEVCLGSKFSDLGSPALAQGWT